jgi:hypothetical protein
LTLTPPVTSKPKPRQNGNSITIQGGNVIIINGVQVSGPSPPRDVLKPTSEEPKSRLLLSEGKAASRPTFDAGSLRIRSLPIEPLTAAAKEAGLLSLDLDVTAVPGTSCLRVFGVRVGEATDDQGQSLKQKPSPIKPPAPKNNTGSIMVINGQVIDPNGEANSLGHPPTKVPVRLQLGEKPAKAIAKLSGTMTVLVQTPPEKLVTVEGVLKSVNQTVQGVGGASVKVLEVTKLDGDQVRLRVLVEPCPRLLGDGAVNRNPFAPMDGERLFLAASNFTLLDDQNKPFEVVKAINKGTEEAQELELVYKPNAGQSEAARFVFTGPRRKLIEVPFTLSDIPLP